MYHLLPTPQVCMHTHILIGFPQWPDMLCFQLLNCNCITPVPLFSVRACSRYVPFVDLDRCICHVAITVLPYKIVLSLS